MAKPAWVTLLETELDIDPNDVPDTPSAGWTNIKIDFLTYLLDQYAENMEMNDDPKILVFVSDVIQFVDGGTDADVKARLITIAKSLAAKSYRVGQTNAKLACNVCKYALRDYSAGVAAAARTASEMTEDSAAALLEYSDEFMDLVTA